MLKIYNSIIRYKVMVGNSLKIKIFKILFYSIKKPLQHLKLKRQIGVL